MKRTGFACAVVFAVFGSGCSAVSEMPEPEESLEPTVEAPIVNGTPATAYPEAALVDMYRNGRMGSICSGAVIAPRVVLTAGHCVAGFTSWRIKTPFAGNQSADSSGGETYDWRDTGSQNVNPNWHDI